MDPVALPEPPATADDDPNCAAYVAVSAPVSVDWLDMQVALGACTANPPSILGDPALIIGPLPFYGSCQSTSSSPSNCELSAGLQTCIADRWTVLCARNSDCPAGAICAWSGGTGDVPAGYTPPFGSCERACSLTGSAECGRCDLACEPSLGYCGRIRSSADAG